MTKLSINLNKVALLRNQRPMPYPSVLAAAETVIGAGAHGITVHPRPDGRHIRRADVLELARLIGGRQEEGIEFNVEGYPSEDFLDLAEQVKPHQVTLVPDPPEASTSDHGWDCDGQREFLRSCIARLQGAGIRVSLFVDPDAQAVASARDTGTDAVELYTGPYGAAYGGPDEQATLAACRTAGSEARDLGLRLNAGHDLNLDNLGKLCQSLPWLAEVSIGHAFTADALAMGYARAVKSYLDALDHNDN